MLVSAAAAASILALASTPLVAASVEPNVRALRTVMTDSRFVGLVSPCNTGGSSRNTAAEWLRTVRPRFCVLGPCRAPQLTFPRPPRRAPGLPRRRLARRGDRFRRARRLHRVRDGLVRVLPTSPHPGLALTLACSPRQLGEHGHLRFGDARPIQVVPGASGFGLCCCSRLAKLTLSLFSSGGRAESGRNARRPDRARRNHRRRGWSASTLSRAGFVVLTVLPPQSP